MQRALPSQRASNGFLESPEANQGVGLPVGDIPGEASGSTRKYIHQLEPSALEKEVSELRKQLAEQDRRLNTERKEIEKREALVRFAAGELRIFATDCSHVVRKRVLWKACECWQPAGVKVIARTFPQGLCPFLNTESNKMLPSKQ